ncbi:response regulator transcription factor [Streptomyces sp. NPDC093109]|uniref:response regulator transcription factor n=1 Tax=Streptomyces sp. NPDC093109 TaxID=3154977 RepID=UPI003450D0AA
MHGTADVARGDGQDVLVVAGDPGDTELLVSTLESAGYRVDAAGSASEGVARLKRARFDLVVWDAVLPDNKDLARGRRLVLENRPPLLFLITCDYLHTLLPELGGGAEDYVTKPFRAPEILARVQILLLGNRRSGQRPAMPRYRDLVLDDATCRARRGSRPLDLTPAEYRLLRYMLVNAGQVLSKEQISRHVWGDLRADEAIEKLVSRLRQKVAQEGPALIHTRRGFGYTVGQPTA